MHGYADLYYKRPNAWGADQSKLRDKAFSILEDLLRLGLPIYDDSEVLALTVCPSGGVPLLDTQKYNLD